MKLHNTRTRSVDEFKPLSDNTVSLYTCGPTVYAEPHIGNWIAFVRWDILARTLGSHYDVKWYMNITDVGHLTSDADDGEDKMEKGAQREGLTAWDVAQRYTESFIKGLAALNISIPRDHLVKATDYIPEQIALIQELEAKGFIYLTDDGVYFDSSKFPTYGEMARLDIAGLQSGKRVETGQKRNPTDFALWKFSPIDSLRDMEWESPWGTGFPGWHLECSALLHKFLGKTADIHTGGIDHIPVHHTNEIAQSEAANDAPLANVWLHSNFLQVDGVKLSKSLHNSYTLQDLEEKGYSALDFRMFVLQSHYRTEANFTWESLEVAQKRQKELQAMADLRFQTIADAPEFTPDVPSIRQALDDDLNTPKVLSILSAHIPQAIPNSHNLEEYITFVDSLLGLQLKSSKDITDIQKQLLADRTSARAAKNWSESDKIRDELLKQSIGINDTQYGAIWYRI